MILDKGDRFKVYTLAATFAVWWIFIGKRKYSIKGMK